MRTRRRSYTTPTPPSSFPKALTAKPTVPVSATNKRRKLHQSCIVQARGNPEPKKCVTGLWDPNIPTDLVQEILSRLGLKANIHASLVCKTWFEAAVSVRKLQRRPWLFFEVERSHDTGSSYILVDPIRSKSHIYKLDFPELKVYHIIPCSKDGWVLMRSSQDNCVLFLNPFTKKRFYLPEGLKYYDGSCLAFSAPPTSASCLVMECVHHSSSPVTISTWRPGETSWTIHRFEERKRRRLWDKCVFSNGMFYCLSTRGHLGVFDPSKVTWNVLPVKPCPNFNTYIGPLLLTEHEGDIFVMFTSDIKNPLVFRLNLKRNVWEEKTDRGGLTVFENGRAASLTIAGLSVEERNRIYPSSMDYYTHFKYYLLVGGKGFRTMSDCVAWVEPPDQFLC